MFLLIEKGTIVATSDFNHFPEGSTVIELSSEDAERLKVGSHEFDVKTMSLKDSELYRRTVIQQKLVATDWKVLRHIREKALGVETSMTDAEYTALELERQTLAKSI